MCGRFAVLTYEEVAAVAEAVERRLEHPRAALDVADPTRAQAFPGSSIALLSPNSRGALEAREAVWGFQTDWSKKLVFNTRIESAMDGSAMWREAAGNGRCIIPAAAFFEPHATKTIRSPRTGRPMKQPFAFTDPEGLPLLLAGVQQEGRCSIVTTEPNRWVAPVHNRMPLVMRFQEASLWLGPEWHTLADRSSIELHAQPERLQAPQRNDQLSLF